MSELQKPQAFPEKAVWLHRKYRRHSVERDVPHFCGWQLLLKCTGSARNEDEKKLLAFTFETGGRISEVLHLRTVNFRVVKGAKPPIIIVTNMPLAKRYHKVKELRECDQCGTLNPKGLTQCQKCGKNLFEAKKRFQTEKDEVTRKEFVIRTDEPLARTVLKSVYDCMQRQQSLIFLNPETDKPFSRKWAYKVLRRIGAENGIYLYPHRLRSERASHLANSLKAESLLEWFSWESWDTAKKYARKGAFGLAKELGVEIPEQNTQ